MRYEIELLLYYARQPRTRRIAAIVLPLVVVAASLTSNYAPLTDQLTHRFLESEGRAPAQIAARAQQQEAAARAEQAKREAEQARRDADQKEQEAAQARVLALARADEQARQQRLAQDQAAHQRQLAVQQQQIAIQQAQAAQQAQLAQLYTTSFADYRNAWKAMANYKPGNNEVTFYTRDAETLVKRPDFFNRDNPIPVSIEETVTNRDCQNPHSSYGNNPEIWSNLLGCIAFFARQNKVQGADFLQYRLAAVTYARAVWTPGRNISDSLFLDHVMEYIWTWWVDEQLVTGELQDISVPPLIIGNTFNPALALFLSKDFANRLFETLSVQEKINLRDTTYPRITRIVAAYSALADVCRRLHRNPCVTQ